jgi:hypothetical protein
MRTGGRALMTAVDRQIEQLSLEATAREEQRTHETFASEEQKRLSLSQAEVTKAAGKRGAVGIAAAASSAADIGLVGTVGGVASNLVSDPTINTAIGDFFSSFGSSSSGLPTVGQKGITYTGGGR